MNFVNEQDVAIFQIGQQRGQVTRFGDDRAGGGAKTDAHFLCDNLRQCGLAKTRWAKEQHMVQWLPPPLRRLNKHPQIIARGGLPDKFGERFGTKRGVNVFRPLVRRGEAVFVSHVLSLRPQFLPSHAYGFRKSKQTAREMLDRQTPLWQQPLGREMVPLYNIRWRRNWGKNGTRQLYHYRPHVHKSSKIHEWQPPNPGNVLAP